MSLLPELIAIRKKNKKAVWINKLKHTLNKNTSLELTY